MEPRGVAAALEILLNLTKEEFKRFEKTLKEVTASTVETETVKSKGRHYCKMEDCLMENFLFILPIIKALGKNLLGDRCNETIDGVIESFCEDSGQDISIVRDRLCQEGIIDW